MTHDKLTEEINTAIARKAVDALIEDAKSNFTFGQTEAFYHAVRNAVRHSDPACLHNLREFLHKRGIDL